MGRYRTINVDLNRQYRNDLNKNFEDIEKDINKSESDIKRIEAESKERDNLIAGTDVEAIINRINTTADNADVQAQHAKTQGDYAKTQGDYAKSQGDYAKSKGDYANEKAILADEAAANANSEASNLSQLKIDVVDATQNANTATNNANTAATNANNSATYATEQGDYAKQEADRVAGMDVGALTTKINEIGTNLNALDNKFTQHSAQTSELTNVKLAFNQSIPSGTKTDINFTNAIITNNIQNKVSISNGKIKLTKGVYEITVYTVYSPTSNSVGVRAVEIDGLGQYYAVKSLGLSDEIHGLPLILPVKLSTPNDLELKISTSQATGTALSLLNITNVQILKVGEVV